MQKQPWSREELDYLSEHWPKGGWRTCKDYFIERGRGHNSVRGKAEALALRVEGRTYFRQESTDWIDEQLRLEYRNGRPNLKMLARRVHREHGWLKWRASVLGLSRVGSLRPWADEEITLLEDCLNKSMSKTAIYRAFQRKGFKRSLGAISSRVYYQGWQWQRDKWTMRETAQAFQIDEHSVEQWLRNGWLKGRQRRGPSCDDLPERGKLNWQIELKAVRDFMLKHPSEWDHRRMDKVVLLELLCGGESGLGLFRGAGT